MNRILAINAPYTAEKISFGGKVGFDLEYSEATKQFIINKVNKLKNVSITFRETGDYSILKSLQTWMDKIYNSEYNFFYKYNPLGEIIIKIEDPYSSSGSNSGLIKMNNTILQDFSYPEYDWSSGDQQKITASFSFQWAELVTPTL